MRAEDVLADLRSRATQGTWYDDGYRVYGGTDAEDKRDGPVIYEYKHNEGEQDEANAAHVCALHNLEPAVLEVIKAARENVVSCFTPRATYDDPDFKVYRGDEPCGTCAACWLRSAFESLDAQAEGLK